MVYAPVTGFSLRFSSTGLERAEDPVLNGSDERLFGRRLADFFTGRDPRGGNVDTTRSRGSRPPGKRCNRAAQAVPGLGGGPGTLHGKILAMVSAPSYDPNLLSTHDTEAQGTAWEAVARRSPPADKPGDLRALPAGVDVQGHHHRRGAAGRDQREQAVDRRSPDHAAEQHATLENYGGAPCGIAEGPAAGSLRALLQHRLRRTWESGWAATRSATPPTRSGSTTRPPRIPLEVAESTVGPMSDGAAVGMSSMGQKDVAVTPLQNAMVAAAIANKAW